MGYFPTSSMNPSVLSIETSDHVGPLNICQFDTDVVDDFPFIKCSLNAIQEGTPWIDSNIVNKEPYLFRKIAGTASRIGNHLFDKLVGGTVAFNQQVNGFWGNGATFTTNPDGSIIVTSTGETTFFGLTVRTTNDNVKGIIGHKYFCYADILSSSISSLLFFDLGNWSASQYNTFSQSSGKYQKILEATSNVSTYFNACTNGTSLATDTFTVKNLQIIDLTAMFGSTIADYIYSLEQATAGAGVAFFRKLFPKPYHAYNAGELMSVKTTAHKIVGFNALDIDRTAGTITGSGGGTGATPRDFDFSKYYVGLSADNWYNAQKATGSISNGVITVSSTDNAAYGMAFPVKCLPNTTYYIKSSESTNGVIRVGFFRADGTYITYTGSGDISNNTFTTPDGCYIFTIAFCANANNTTATFKNVCINISDTDRNGEYEPYTEHNYALDDVELRGLFKLDSNNKLYADGDTYESNGDVTRKRNRKTFNGSENWYEYGSGTNRFYAFIDDMKKAGSDLTVVADIICDKYYVTAPKATAGDKTISGGDVNTNYIIIKDSQFSSVSDIQTWLSTHNIVVEYEKAIPTTETADPFTNPQQVDANGTEEYVDNRSVPIPVGHESYYADIYDITGFTACKISVKDGSNVEKKSATIQFGQTVYDGYLEYKNGAWVFTGTDSLTDLGSIDWSRTSQDSDDSHFRFYSDDLKTTIKPSESGSTLPYAITSVYQPASANDCYSHTSDGIFAVDTSGRLLIWDSAKRTLDYAKFKAAVSGVQIKYKLATPFTLTLTGAQLETLLGENRVSHNCNGDTEVEFPLTIKKYIEDHTGV